MPGLLHNQCPLSRGTCGAPEDSGGERGPIHESPPFPSPSQTIKGTVCGWLEPDHRCGSLERRTYCSGRQFPGGLGGGGNRKWPLEVSPGGLDGERVLGGQEGNDWITAGQRNPNTSCWPTRARDAKFISVWPWVWWVWVQGNCSRERQRVSV